VKGFKAKGKRISTYEVESIVELEPVRFPEEPEETEEPIEAEEPILDPDAGKSQQQVIDEMTGQLRLFPDEE
jgi:topoisomerase-4 subunit A